MNRFAHVTSLIVMLMFSVESNAENGPCDFVVPGQVFCDDFSDGSATDGEPERWGTLFGGTQTVVDGSLVITKSLPRFPASQVIPLTSYSDISIRSQMRLLEGDAIGFAARRSPGTTYGGFAYSDRAEIGRGDTGEIFDSAPLDIDVVKEDVLMQLDVIGDSLELWVWSAGEAMPSDPLISAVDDALQSGTFYLWAGEVDAGNSMQSGAFRFVQVATQPIRDPISGDFDGDGVLSAADVDSLAMAIRVGSSVRKFDLNADGNVDHADHRVWVKDLKNTYFGDADLDSEFNSIDFVAVFTAAEYEDAIEDNSGWADGDWNADGEFASSDFVVAFQDDGYEQGPRVKTNAVPEPASLVMLMTALTGIAIHRRRAGRISGKFGVV